MKMEKIGHCYVFSGPAASGKTLAIATMCAGLTAIGVKPRILYASKFCKLQLFEKDMPGIFGGGTQILIECDEEESGVRMAEKINSLAPKTAAEAADRKE